uniref:Uncharacterized protein n=1 Tax=Ditylenchus dipsaci TaxID=166011 RepID=A0A915D103_9BILA
MDALSLSRHIRLHKFTGFGGAFGSCGKRRKWSFQFFMLCQEQVSSNLREAIQDDQKVWPQFRPASFSVDLSWPLFKHCKKFSSIYHCWLLLPPHAQFQEMPVKQQSRSSLPGSRVFDPSQNGHVTRLVPPLDVWNCFAQLEAYLPAELSPVMHYFSQYYVGTFMDPPMFPVNLWSCYDRLWKVRIELTPLLRLRIEDCRMLWEWNIHVGRLLADLKRIQRTHDFDYDNICRNSGSEKKKSL